MAGTKRDRKRANRQARLAAAAAARRKAAMRRRVVQLAVIAVLVGGLVFLLTSRGDDGEDVETGTTTTVAAGGSAAGKPCVPVADPLPGGAPEVPVKVGPPPTQLLKEDLVTGTGAAVTPGATVTVNYIGVACSTGKIFDASYRGGQPASFSLAGVIKGWQDGIPGMLVGGRRLLGIPPDQAYGSRGSPPNIAPDETLWFVVELLEVKPA